MEIVNLPADLPENLAFGQVIAPNGSDIGKPVQFGYNYLMQQVNDTQRAVNTFSQEVDSTMSNKATYTIFSPNKILGMVVRQRFHLL